MTVVAETATSLDPQRVRLPRVRGLRVSTACLLGFVVALLIAWLLRGVLAPFSPSYVDPTAVLRPIGAAHHPLGTDGYGRDELARLLAGVPISLAFGLLPALVAMLLGVMVGLVAGLFGGFVDLVITAVLDVFLAFPFILLALLLVTILGPSLRNAMLAVTLAVFPKDARLIRAEALSLREREFVMSARMAGAGRFRIIFRHLAPNVFPIALIVASTDVGLMIAATAGLSFLGLGVQAPAVDWGTLISDGSAYITTAPALALLPTFCVAIVSLAFVMAADDLRTFWGTRE